MITSEDMYTRGSEDAAHDDLNPFYYQHYYYYRRGYDETRRQLRQRVNEHASSHQRTLSVLVGIFVVIGATVGLFLYLDNTPRSTGAYGNDPTEHTSLTNRVAAATSLPQTATPTMPSATAEPIVLQVGIEATVVNVGESPLRARRAPGVNQPVEVRFPQDSTVIIVEGPVEADGYIWWRIEGEGGNGWSAEQSLDGVVWLQPR